jgi:hypothetical protein
LPATWSPATPTARSTFGGFLSNVPDLVPDDTNGVEDVFVRDREQSSAPVMMHVSADQLGPKPPGTSIVFTAAGGPAPLQYKFWLYDLTAKTWTLLRDYSPRNSVTWRPVIGGSFFVQAWVRSAGSSANYDAWRNSSVFQVTAPPTLAVTGSAPCPLTVGAPVVLTASTTGGVAPIEYKFWLRNQTAATWTLLRDYATTNQIAVTAEAPCQRASEIHPSGSV